MAIESPRALVTMRASTRQPPLFTFATGRRVGIPIFKALFASSSSFSTGFFKLTQRVLRSSVEEEIEETLYEDAISTSLPPQDASACTRSSRAPLLRHVAAAALSRKLRFKVLEDEPCYARIQDTIDVEVGIERGDSCEEPEIVGAAAVEEVEKIVEVVEEVVEGEVVPENVHAVEEAEIVEAAVIEEAEKVLHGLAPDASVEVVPSPMHDEEHESSKTIYEVEVGTPFYEELDDLPSYVEFAMGTPPEPLFADRIPEVVAYAIFRPPLLSLFASRTGIKPITTRASHHHLLARLSVRFPADVAESL
ncbi:hypothetical protein B0H12DRAFT_196501 [Mycena haematopus]|nr:hypothetical protein B0H12DRAFT_196501 [Mycena haematopus]